MGRRSKRIVPHREDDDGSDSFEMSSDQSRDRSVYLIGEITEASAGVVIAKLTSLSQHSEKPIRFVINTVGGTIDDSLAIYDAMKISRAPIHTVGIGKIMSAGVLLLATGVKGKRLVGARARIMIHNAWGGAIGDPWDIENELMEFKRLAALEEECLLTETTMTRKQLDRILKSRVDHYVTPEQAVKHGIADQIAG